MEGIDDGSFVSVVGTVEGNEEGCKVFPKDGGKEGFWIFVDGDSEEFSDGIEETVEGLDEGSFISVDGDLVGSCDIMEKTEGPFESVDGSSDGNFDTSDCKNEGMPVIASIGAICSLT